MRRSIFRRLADWAAAKRLEADIRAGRKTWGRQPGAVDAAMPVQATIAAKVIRANGQVEELGILSDRTIQVPQSFMDSLRSSTEKQDGDSSN